MCNLREGFKEVDKAMCKNANRDPVLRVACRYGLVDVVEKLLTIGGADASHNDNVCITIAKSQPEHIAAALVELLERHGAKSPKKQKK